MLKNGDVKWCILSSSRNISKISSCWLNKTRSQEQTAKDFYWNYFPKKVARGHIHCGSWGKIPISWPLMRNSTKHRMGETWMAEITVFSSDRWALTESNLWQLLDVLYCRVL